MVKAIARSQPEGGKVQRPSSAFEGYVDFYGYYPAAGGWLIGGWMSYPWAPGEQPRVALAIFTDCMVDDHGVAGFYQREDVSDRGIGFVFLLKAPSRDGGILRRLDILLGTRRHHIQPAPGVKLLEEVLLTRHVLALFSSAIVGAGVQEIRTLLSGVQHGLAGHTALISCYGYQTVARGWLFSGSLGHSLGERDSPDTMTISFENGELRGEPLATLCQWPNMSQGTQGVVLFLNGDDADAGSLVSVTLEAGGEQTILYPAPNISRLGEVELAELLVPLVERATDWHRDGLLGVLASRPYRDTDTLPGLSTRVLMDFDEAILVGDTGLVLMGWMLAHPGEIREIHVRSGQKTSVLDLSSSIRIDRSDVLDAFTGQGFNDLKCGYIAYLPNAVTPGYSPYVQVETVRREIGYRPIPPARQVGIAAIKRLLSVIDMRFVELRNAFDAVLGPAVADLNRARLTTRPALTVTQYGTPPVSPRCSVIIPLFGRLDYVEYQLALLSANPGAATVEFIYVLDEPARRREAQYLFTSVHRRFALPFKAILLDANVGFAPASNIGLQHSTGAFVAFMNSDVFPGTPDWLEQLTGRLNADPTLGVVGPMLLFEDGAVQHRGMIFERLPEFGSLTFGMHPDKGMRPPREPRLVTHPSITGACMVMSRALALQLGGFDEAFIIGDFEDSDLCLKVQAAGYHCAVDEAVELYHLERKSQAASNEQWRMNLTVYNAWQHDRRWGATIVARQG